MWKGVPASELSREDLLQAYEWAVRALEDERRFHAESLALAREFTDMAKQLARRAS